MTHIQESFPGRRDGHYSIIFGDQDIGSLISAIHATSIRAGNELERIITKLATTIEPNQLDAFFNKTLTPGVYIIPKRTMRDRRLKFDQTPDCLVVNVEKNTCTIIEIKLGDTFDTKKSQGEVDNLTKYSDKLNRATTYRVSFAVCFWYAKNKTVVIDGFKRTLTEKQALTGAEFCKMVNINYLAINAEMASHQQANREFIFQQINQLQKKYRS